MARYLIVLISSLTTLNTLYSQLPSPRASAHLFYDKPTRSLLLFDGYNSGTRPLSGKSDVWKWKENAWKKIDSNDQPMRTLSAAAYIDDKNEIFIYGGLGNALADSLRDTYIYNGSGWKTIQDKSIGTHDHHKMIYDKANKMIVVYGGSTGNRELDTVTWIFKDNKWKALHIPSPGPRFHHAMAYDIVRKKTVLFGGFGAKKKFDGTSEFINYDDTWEFDGKSWTKIPTTLNPGARGYISMVYDPVSNRVLLFGGGSKGDLWAWDGKKWEQLSENGPRRILSAIAFDPDRNKLFVFGGNGGEGDHYIYSDLWEWDGKNWTRLNEGEIYKFDKQKEKFIKIEK